MRTASFAKPTALLCGLCLALVFALSAPAFAQQGGFSGDNAGASGGFTGPGPGVITVEEAKSRRDDAKVVLMGNITHSLGGEHYTFRDATGSVTVEIDHDKWKGQTISPSDLVEIQGEVDSEWTSFKIDVDRITKR